MIDFSLHQKEGSSNVRSPISSEMYAKWALKAPQVLLLVSQRCPLTLVILLLELVATPETRLLPPALCSHLGPQVGHPAPAKPELS